MKHPSDKKHLPRGPLIAGILVVTALVVALGWHEARGTESTAAIVALPPMSPAAARPRAPELESVRGESPATQSPERAAPPERGSPADGDPSAASAAETPPTPTPVVRLAVTLRTALGEHPRAELERLDRHQAGTLTVTATRERPPRVFELDDPRPMKAALGSYRTLSRTDTEERGVLELEQPPPVYVSVLFHHAVVAWRHVPAGGERVELVLPAGALSGALATLNLVVVSAANQEPLPARVSVRTGDASISGARADANGALAVEHLPPGTSLIEVSAPGHATWRTRVSLQPGETRGLETIALEPMKIVKGELLGPRPLPPGLRLEYTSLAPLESGRPATWAAGVTFPRSDGYCEFPADGEGPWLVRAVHDASAVADAGCAPLGSTSLVVDTRGLPEPRFRLALEAALPVVLPTRSGIADTVRLQDARGHTLDAVRLGDAAQTVYLVPGAYEAGYTCGGSQLELRPFLVGDAALTLDPAP